MSPPIVTDGPMMAPERGIHELTASYGQSIGATAAESWADSPLSQLMTGGEIAQASGSRGGMPETDPLGNVVGDGVDLTEDVKPAVPRMDIIEANDRVKKAGLDKHLTLPDQPDIPPAQLAIMMRNAQARAEREATIERGPQGFIPSALQVGTSFLVGAADPINVASAFIPVMGELRYGKVLAAAGDSLTARLATRAAVGAAQGAVGQAALEPLDWWAHTQEGRDFGMSDVLHNIMFGALLGGGLHAGGGFISDAYRRRVDRPLFPYDIGEPLEEHTPWSELREQPKPPPIPRDILGEFPGIPEERAGQFGVPLAQDLDYQIRSPLGAWVGDSVDPASEVWNVRIIRGDDGKIDAVYTDQMGVTKVSPRDRELSPEHAIAATLGDHEQGNEPDPSKVTVRSSVDEGATPPPSPTVDIINDLPPRAHEDAMRVAISDLINGDAVRSGDVLEAAGKTDPRIAESLDIPKSALYLVRDENTGDTVSYSINGADGSNVGFAEFAIDGDTARVLDIASFAFNGDRNRYGEVRNSIGARQMRDLLAQFRELHPEVKTFTADRVSGARRGGEYDAGLKGNEIEVKLPSRSARGHAAADPQTWSLFEFLAHEGGIKPDPELAAIEPARASADGRAAASERGQVGLPGEGQGRADGGQPRGAGAGDRGAVPAQLDKAAAWRGISHVTPEFDTPEAIAASNAAAKVEPPKTKLDERVTAAEKAETYAKSMYDMFAHRLPPEERARLEEHIADLERQQADRDTVSQRGAACLFEGRGA